MSLPLGDERSLEVRVRDRAPVADVLRELERALDVLAGGDVVALKAMAPRAPAEDVGAEQVAREPRLLGERERLVQKRERGADARELVATDAEAEQDLRAVDVREVRAFDDLAGMEHEGDRVAHLAVLLQRPRLTRERAHVQRRRPGPLDGRARCAELVDRGGVLVRLGQRLGAGEQRLDLRPLLGRDPHGEKRRVHGEPLRQPGDGRLGGTGLSALDLADVLLGEPASCELGLRQPRGNPQGPHALAQANARARDGCHQRGILGEGLTDLGGRGFGGSCDVFHAHRSQRARRLHGLPQTGEPPEGESSIAARRRQSSGQYRKSLDRVT